MGTVRMKQTSSKKATTAPVPASATSEEANTKLSDFAHRRSQQEKARETAAEASGVSSEKRKTAKPQSASLAALPPLPKLPKGPRKSKPSKPCECGCGGMTQGGRFLPGHDARLHGWALRVERGLIKASEVPEPHTAAVKALLAQHKKVTKAVAEHIAEGGSVE